MSNHTAPLISVELSLNPPNFIESEAMELSVTAVSHAPYPITIFDYSTIFNVQLAQSESRSIGIFHLQDIDTNTELCLQYRRRKKRSIRYELGHSDSRYFHTLHPEIPYKFSAQCHVSFMELVPGHRYRLSAGEEEKVRWWKKGTKEDVLQRPSHELLESPSEPSGDPITLGNIAPLEFKVPSAWRNIASSISSDIRTIRAMAGIMPSETLTPSSVTATMSVGTSQISEDLAMEFFISILSHTSTSITIWIWPTMLSTNSSQRSLQGSSQSAYTLTHLDTNTSVPTEEMFHTEQQGLVHPEDRYFHTLQPEQPYKFSAHFTPVFARQLELRPGRYRLAVDNSLKFKWWKEGTKEDIVPPLGQKPANDMYQASGEPIVITDIQPIEFTIRASQ